MPTAQKTTRAKTARIVVLTDGDMAAVYLNRKLVMLGNEDDFYPGCHGITKYGNFKGSSDLVEKMTQKLKAGRQRVTVQRPESFWDDDKGEFVLGPRPVTRPLASKTVKRGQVKLSARTMEKLRNLDKALTQVDGLFESLIDDGRLGDEGMDEDSISQLDTFRESIEWPEFHRFMKSLRYYTNFTSK